MVCMDLKTCAHRNVHFTCSTCHVHLVTRRMHCRRTKITRWVQHRKPISRFAYMLLCRGVSHSMLLFKTPSSEARTPQVRYFYREVPYQVGPDRHSWMRIAVKELLAKRVDVNAADTKGRTALHFASTKGDRAMLQCLIAHGANLNSRDGIGNTPLHLAACTNHTAIVTLLLQAGCDIRATDRTGQTPVHYAQSHLQMLRVGAVTVHPLYHVNFAPLSTSSN